MYAVLVINVQLYVLVKKKKKGEKDYSPRL